MDFLGDVLVSLLGSLGSLGVAYVIYWLTRRDTTAEMEAARRREEDVRADERRRQAMSDLIASIGNLVSRSVNVTDSEEQEAFYEALRQFIPTSTASMFYLHQHERLEVQALLKVIGDSLETSLALAQSMMRGDQEVSAKAAVQDQASRVTVKALETQTVLAHSLSRPSGIR